MKPRRWTPEVIAQAYRGQGVPWTEAEIQAESETLAREMQRMDIRKHNADRKFYRNELPVGLAEADEAYEKLEVFNKHERLRLEDWSREYPSQKGAGAYPGSRVRQWLPSGGRQGSSQARPT